jgi:hypothetical protein
MCDVVADLAVTVIPDADHIQAPARPELHAALRQFFESVEAGSAARA